MPVIDGVLVVPAWIGPAKHYVPSKGRAYTFGLFAVSSDTLAFLSSDLTLEWPKDEVNITWPRLQGGAGCWCPPRARVRRPRGPPVFTCHGGSRRRVCWSCCFSLPVLPAPLRRLRTSRCRRLRCAASAPFSWAWLAPFSLRPCPRTRTHLAVRRALVPAVSGLVSLEIARDLLVHSRVLCLPGYRSAISLQSLTWQTVPSTRAVPSLSGRTENTRSALESHFPMHPPLMRICSAVPQKLWTLFRTSPLASTIF